MHTEQRSTLNYKRIMVAGILLVAIIFTGWYVMDLFFNKNITTTYQAYFLLNGQVYFGKDIERKNGYTILKNVYYLELVNNEQFQNQAGVDKQTQLSLKKLGTELHGPTDTLYVNDDHILFYEDLRPDSNVLKSIESKSLFKI